ncbi:Eukaryotic translation initiation factor 3 subunit J like protein [Aduncisulcus paluster]|uniref:Eukaryotic translation initiation factor 3 subunit J like protein n=1 Tax=Aduncisulcus paluster TaxID=2918883 RepID=A0ABQ5JZ40_9EUKA|nr:Eukaryotic translation initiation factor 3 subunit J like protein [Aduncisulcus paluster]
MDDFDLDGLEGLDDLEGGFDDLGDELGGDLEDFDIGADDAPKEDWEKQADAKIAVEEEKTRQRQERENEKKRREERRLRMKGVSADSVVTDSDQRIREKRRNQERQALQDVDDLVQGMDFEEDSEGGVRVEDEENEFMGETAEEKDEKKASEVHSIDEYNPTTSAGLKKLGRMIIDKIVPFSEIKDWDIQFVEMLKDICRECLQSKGLFPEDAKSLAATCNSVYSQRIKDERDAKKNKKKSKGKPKLKRSRNISDDLDDKDPLADDDDDFFM